MEIDDFGFEGITGSRPGYVHRRITTNGKKMVRVGEGVVTGIVGPKGP